MYSDELEELIDLIIADGHFTEKERKVLRARAKEELEDPDEVEVVVEGRLAKRNQSTPPPPPFVNERKQTDNPTNLKPESSIKYGSQRKCPNCGANVVGGSMKCVECGADFFNVRAVNSVIEFSEKIDEIDKRYSNEKWTNETDASPRALAIASTISTFPIPNTREDLLEFLFFTQSKMKHAANSTQSEFIIRKAYKAKYFECVEKAKIYFSDDPRVRQILQNSSLEKDSVWSNIAPKNRGGIIAFSVWLFVMILIGILILIFD